MKTRLVIEINEWTVKMARFSLGEKPALDNILIENIEGLAPAALEQRLKDIAKANAWCLQTSQVIGIIPRSLAIIRYLRLPSHDVKEIAPMVELQAVNHIPYNREDVELDFDVVERLADGYALVMVVIIPREALMRSWDMLTKIGLKPQGLTLSSKGLFTLSGKFPSGALGASLVIDIDQHHSEVIVCSANGVLSSRSMNLGSQNMLSPNPEAWVSQVLLTREAYRKEQLGPDIQRVLVFSPPHIYEDVTILLQQQLSLPVERRNSFEKMSVPKNLKWPALMRESGVSISALVGVGADPQPLAINLIPKEILRQGVLKVVRRQWTFLGISTAIVVVLAAGAFMLPYVKQTQFLKDLETQLTRLKRQSIKIQNKLDTVNAVEKILGQRIIFVDEVKTLYGMVPSSISLTKFTLMNKSQLSVEGYANDAASINTMQRSMVDSSMYEQVTLDYVTKRVTAEGEINYFKITARIKAKE